MFDQVFFYYLALIEKPIGEFTLMDFASVAAVPIAIILGLALLAQAMVYLASSFESLSDWVKRQKNTP